MQVAFADSMSVGWLRGIDLAIDLLFLIDVYINFRTGAPSPRLWIPPLAQSGPRTQLSRVLRSVCTLTTLATRLRTHLLSCGRAADNSGQRRAGYFSLDAESGMWSLELKGSRCAAHYFCRWALVDILSVLPLDLFWLAFSDADYGVHLNIVRLPRCLKLLRLPRLFRCGAPPTASIGARMCHAHSGMPADGPRT